MTDVISKYRADTPSGLNMYFILDACSMRVKIGITKNLRQRFRMINQAASTELELLGVVYDIQPEYEAFVHGLWGDLRRKNEWFESAPDLLRWVKFNTCTGEKEITRQTKRRVAYGHISQRGMSTQRGATHD